MLKALRYVLPHFFYIKLLKFREFVRREKKLSDDVPISKKIWLWRNGFNSLNLRMFKLTPGNIADYLDNRTYHKMHPINGPYSKLIDNKAFLPLILPDYQNYAFDVFIFVNKGRIAYTNLNHANVSLIELIEPLLASKTLISKPSNLGGGDGFKIINKENFRQAIETITDSERDYVITEKLEQHQYSNDIFPDSINTIRLLLMRDVDTHELFVARGFHRFGTLASKPVDNIDKGGVVANLDLATGTLGKILIYRSDYKDRKLFEYYETHPDTGKVIEGLKIPRWEETKEKVIKLFDQLQWFVYGGIDIVMTKDSFKILEINSFPNVDTMQMFEPPLLTSERAAKFYKFYASDRSKITNPLN